jgi:surface antigen
LAGAAIGGKMGKSMDQTDQMRAQRSLERIPTGRSTSWTNPDTGYEYTVTPTRTYYAREAPRHAHYRDSHAHYRDSHYRERAQYREVKRPCREYSMDAIIGGRKETIYSTACRTADGSWEAQN